LKLSKALSTRTLNRLAHKNIVQTLIGIATLKGSERDPFICCDMVNQDRLYVIQEKLMALIDALDRGEAYKAMPFMYDVKKVTP